MKEKQNHSNFEELCALANSGILTAAERLELRQHLEVCPECAEAYREYCTLTSEGLPLLASTHVDPLEVKSWSEKPTWKKLLARIRDAERQEQKSKQTIAGYVPIWAGLMGNSWTRAAVAASVVLMVGYGTYRLGIHRTVIRDSSLNSAATQKLSTEETSLRQILSAQTAKISALEVENLDRQDQVESLREELANLQSRSLEFATANEKSETEVQSLTTERNTLSVKLAQAQQAYDDAQKELAMIKSERDKVLLQEASLETSLQDLKAAHEEQEQRLRNDEQYLAADRDIRELMGARKLYIADVFDVDSSSRTRKPYGRVFYTENKSLIFYAFDLDREPRVKNAAFQVWGEKDAPQGQKAHPLNLGILYMDSESNRRWVLRSDDSKQLAEIDAVFVTVEPRGGSAKPTSKPLLYALLRKEANHP
jgi:hypothetical protein